MKNSILLVLAAIYPFLLVGCSSEKSSFGPYGSTHTHMDFKAYVLGKQINFDLPRYQAMDDLTHVENNDGEMIHVHATGITLGYFFKSLGFELTDECFALDTGNQYCNIEEASLKVFVKSLNSGWESLLKPADYMLQDLDKILVTYGTETRDEIKKQQESVTDKAGYT